MLGYTEKDLKNMLESISLAYEVIHDHPKIKAGLLEASDFLQGLWAEGYCD